MEAVIELVRQAREQGLEFTGLNGLLKQLTKAVIETVLNEEMTEHLGRESTRKPVRAEPGIRGTEQRRKPC